MGWDGILVLTLAALASSFAACMHVRLAMDKGHLPWLEKLVLKAQMPARPRKKR